MICVLIGMALPAHIDVHGFKFTVGQFLFHTCAAMRRDRKTGGRSCPTPVTWATLVHRDKRRQRVTVQPLPTIIGLLTLAVLLAALSASGSIASGTLGMTAFCAPLVSVSSEADKNF